MRNEWEVSLDNRMSCVAEVSLDNHMSCVAITHVSTDKMTNVCGCPPLPCPQIHGWVSGQKYNSGDNVYLCSFSSVFIIEMTYAVIAIGETLKREQRDQSVNRGPVAGECLHSHQGDNLLIVGQ